MRIRHYGILANRAKHTKLDAARAALDQPAPKKMSWLAPVSNITCRATKNMKVIRIMQSREQRDRGFPSVAAAMPQAASHWNAIV